MTHKELYDLTKYLFEAWERGADYDKYHMDCQYVLEGLVKPEQQPYGWIDVYGHFWNHKTSEDDVPLYTIPPQRKPLTDEEIETIAEQTLFPIKFARAIEAKLKENT